MRKLIGCAGMEYGPHNGHDCPVYEGNIDNCFIKCPCISRAEKEEVIEKLKEDPDYIKKHMDTY